MFLYLCDQCDLAGFWEIDIERAAFDTGCAESAISKAIEELARCYEANDAYLWIKRFIRFQGNFPLKETNPAHKGIIRMLTERQDFSENVVRTLNGDELPSSFEGASKGLFRSLSIGKGLGKGKGQSKVSDSTDRIIARLNELRESSWEWVRYTPLTASPTNVEQINGRLKEYAEADLVLVLEYLAVKDGGDEKSRGYYDCVTPFRVKNFERRLVMAREWEARGRPSKNGDDGVRDETLRPQGHDVEQYEKWFSGGKSGDQIRAGGAG